jgi:hypothetical protein
MEIQTITLPNKLIENIELVCRKMILENQNEAVLIEYGNMVLRRHINKDNENIISKLTVEGCVFDLCTS